MPKLTHGRMIAIGAAVYCLLTAVMMTNAIRDYGQAGWLMAWIPGLVGVLAILLILKSKTDRRTRRVQSRIRGGTFACVVAGATDPSVPTGSAAFVSFYADNKIRIAVGDRWVWSCPHDEVVSVGIEGPGTTFSGGGFIGGGFDGEGALLGIAAASLLNSATTRTSTLTRILITARRGALTLQTSEVTPEEVRTLLATLLAQVRHRSEVLRASASDDSVGQHRVLMLERLAQLHATGALTDLEFEAEKRRALTG